MGVEVALLDEPFLQGLGENHEHLTALEVGTVEHSVDRGGEGVFVGLVLAAVEEVVDGVAVGEYDGIVAPFVAQDVDEQTVAGAAGPALETLVGAHHLAHVGLLHKGLEGGEVGLPEVSVGGLDVHRVAQGFRTAVYGVVLGTGVGLEVALVIALHAEHGLYAEHGIHIGVFAASLLASSPAGVTEDVHVRTPEGEFGVAWVVDDAHGHIKQFGVVVVGAVPVGAGFVAHG